MIRHKLTLLLLVFTLLVHTDPEGTLIVDFGSYYADPLHTTAVWNKALRTVHLPFVVDRTHDQLSNDGIEQEDETLDIGTGADGAFIPATYAEFNPVGNTFTFDTSKVYEFTEFELSSGYTLKGSGPDPLRIRVQADVVIKGTIDLSGHRGADAAPGGSAAAGAPGPGGGAGGQGTVLSGSAASSGVGRADSGNGGGLAGSDQAAGNAGGGGGAGHSTQGQVGSAIGGGAGGAAYTYPDLDYLLPLTAGSGGGGGGGKTTPTLSNGAGGGGGGGAFECHAGGDVIIQGGTIKADGGDGGSRNATTAGPGGGGSGGGIRILSGGSFTNDNVVRAKGGAGGAGVQGSASDGITYVVNKQGTISNGGGSVDPPPNPNPLGQTFYSKHRHILVTKPYDSGNPRPRYLAFDATVSTPASTSVTIEVAGSSDAFESDDTGFVELSDLDALDGKRYIRYRFILSTQDRTVTPEVRGITARFERRSQNEFSFGWSGCAPH